jgi:hypothetical protein
MSRSEPFGEPGRYADGVCYCECDGCKRGRHCLKGSTEAFIDGACNVLDGKGET